MRHLWSLLVGVIVAPLAWLTMCIGQVGTARQFEAHASSGAFVAGDFLPPLLFLVGAGLVVGVIACLRISPLGPLVAGVAYLASFVALLIWPQRTYDSFGYTFHLSFLDGQGNGDLTTPLTSGVAPLLGAVLVVAVVSAKRWRRWPQPAAVDTAVALEGEMLPPAPLTPAAIGSGPVVAQRAAYPESFSADESPTETQPVRVVEPVGAAAPAADDEPVGTVVWTRGESTGETVPGRGRSPWDTPPGEGAERSSTR